MARWLPEVVYYMETRRSPFPSEAGRDTRHPLEQETLSLEIGQSERLSVTFDAEANANRTLVWHSSDKNIASVDESGEVKALQAGETILTRCCQIEYEVVLQP